mmetsp:Transcript_28685/g.86456  ORF Transcript_28685/g.86456 Transcript_28685/m.86456 type:complete len:183 (+) Transcript_28685:3-551(+)
MKHAFGLALAVTTHALRPPTAPPAAPAAPTSTKTERWIDTVARVRVNAPRDDCYAAYSDLTRMPEWCPLLASVTFDEATRVSTWRMGYRGVAVGWTAENLEEAPPSLLRWRSTSGARNYGRATFEDGGDATDVEVAITYQTPRVVADLVEGKKAQDFIRTCLAATLRRFARRVEQEHAGGGG